MYVDWLKAIESTALATWVRESTSLWVYPLILTLHTVGLAMLVGTSAFIDARLMGWSRLPLRPLGHMFGLVWGGLALNAASGTLLFMADASAKGVQATFWAKLACIATGVVLARRIQTTVFGPRLDDSAPPADADTEPAPPGARGLAALSLAAWLGAIVAGRLMAYL